MFKTVAQVSTMGSRPRPKGTVVTFDLENPQLPPYVILKRSSVVKHPDYYGLKQTYGVDKPVWEYGTKSEPYPALAIQDDILYIYTEWMTDVTLDIEYLDLRTDSFQTITLAPVDGVIKISADTFGTSVYIFSFCLNQTPLLNSFYHDFTKHHLKFPGWLIFNRASKAMVLDGKGAMWREAAEDEPRFFKMRGATESKIDPNNRHPYAQGLTFEAGSVNIIPYSFEMDNHLNSSVDVTSTLGLAAAMGRGVASMVSFTLGNAVRTDKITLTNCATPIGTSFGTLVSDTNAKIGDLTEVSYATQNDVAFYYDSDYYAFARPFTLRNTDLVKKVTVTVSTGSQLLIPQMEYSESGNVRTTAIRTSGIPVTRAVELLNVLTPQGRKHIDINYNLPINGETNIQTKTVVSSDDSNLIVAGVDIPHDSSIIKGIKVYGDDFPDNLEIDLDKSNGTLPEFMQVNRPSEQYHINHLGEAVYIPPDQPRFHSVLIDGVRSKRGLILTNHDLKMARNEALTTTAFQDPFGVITNIIPATPARPYMTINFKEGSTLSLIATMNMTNSFQYTGGEYTVRAVLRLRRGNATFFEFGIGTYIKSNGYTDRIAFMRLAWNVTTNKWDVQNKTSAYFTVKKIALREEGELLFITATVLYSTGHAPADVFFNAEATSPALSLDVISACYTKSEYLGWYNVPGPYTDGVAGNLETLDIYLPRGVYSNLVYTYQYTDDNFELTPLAEHTLMVPNDGKVTIQSPTTHETYIRKIKLVK